MNGSGIFWFAGFLSYRPGKRPQAFKIVPSPSKWEEILAFFEARQWTPNAMYEATRMFSLNLNARDFTLLFSSFMHVRIYKNTSCDISGIEEDRVETIYVPQTHSASPLSG